MIIDAHVHILNSDEKDLSELLRHADRAGIEKLCISSLSREWVAHPSVAALEEAAADVRTACGRYPDRFVGFVYVSADHIEASLDVLHRETGDGLCRFVKLWISQRADDPRLEPIYEKAIELRTPVMMHTWVKATGNLPDETTMHHALEVSLRYPELRVWMAHYSGRWEEAARVAALSPTLCLDLSGGEPEEGILDTLLRRLPAERIFFGSDAPGRSFAVQLAKVYSSHADAREKELILGGNIHRWLND